MKNTITRVDALNFAIDELTKGGQVDTEYTEVAEILGKIRDQIAKPRKSSDEAKAKAKTKRADARGKMLSEVLPILRVALTGSDGFTAKELYDHCVDQLPTDFTDKKVGYILLHEMADEVVKTEVRGKANIYKMKD